MDAVRVTHIPTNTTVSCEKRQSQRANREEALRMLDKKLLKLRSNAAFGMTTQTTAPKANLPKQGGSGAVMDGGADYFAQVQREKAKAAKKKLKRLQREGKAPKVRLRSEGDRLKGSKKHTPASINKILTKKKGLTATQRREILKARAASSPPESTSAAGGGEGPETISPRPDTSSSLRERIRGQRRATQQPQQIPASVIVDYEAARRDIDDHAGGGGTRVEEIDNRQQLQEGQFLEELRKTQVAETERQFKSMVFIGDQLLSEQDIDLVHRTRAERDAELAEANRVRDRLALETSAHGPFQTPPTRAVVAAQILESLKEDAIQPDFQSVKNDTWRMRKKVVAKFMHVVTKFLVRSRIDDRLARIKKRLGGAITRWVASC